jgi:protein involved in polysaccharide export with SLBB domain
VTRAPENSIAGYLALHLSLNSICRFAVSRDVAVLALFVAALFPSLSFAQGAPPRGTRTASASDLSKENQSLVAAGEEDIENILRTNPGLMIELKHWVAREATEQGQLISESDLSDLTIRVRLHEDAKFRSVATELLQSYGYLTPKVDPNSQLAREDELILEERSKLFVVESTRDSGERTDETPALPPDSLPVKPRSSEGSQRPNAGSVETTSNHSPVDDESAREFWPGTGSSLSSPTLQSASMPLPEDARGGSLLPSGTNLPARRAESPSDVPPELQPERSDAEPSAGGKTAQIPEESAEYDSPRYRAVEMKRGVDFNAHGMVATRDPYSDIPSLREMYMQASPELGTVRRFGIDVFQHRSQDSQNIPMDLPVGPEYVVGPGDSLSIDLWGGVSQRLYRAVDREGRISLPEVGPVLVSGKSLGEVQQTVQQVLRTQFREVSADVSLARLRTVRVYVVGDVEHPGAYDVSSLSTPLNALFLAGGPTERGSLRIVKHYRGQELVEDVDLYALLLHGMKSDLARLENGDTVLVPPIGAGVTVEGMVRRPAIYELRAEKNLADVLQLAGGILPAATLDHIEIERLVDHAKRTMVSLSVSEVEGANGAQKQLESFAVQDKDIIRLFPIASYNQEAVYLEGHVLRPGRYAYRDGMKFSDVVTAYSDLMPEPAEKYAEIIRLNPPDYRPSVESFSLGDILANRAAAPVLKPMDTIRIFGKYDFESAPTVSVWGEVRRPGSYRTSGEIHLSDALHVAGGTTPDALMSTAQIFRTQADSTLKVFSADLQQALSGDAKANIALQPRDRIVVHRNPAKVDPPVVYVKGEISSPGRYPLTTGMRVSDLIRVGGGLRRSANPEIASLTEFRAAGAAEVVGDERSVHIAAVLAGDFDRDLALRDGDTLTIRKISGWDDRGASISVRGEVRHPGTFGIEPGERLSSVIERAGGFSSSAYPYGAVFQRFEVRDQEERSQRSLIQRVQEEQQSLNQLPDGDTNQKTAKLAAIAQWQHVLDNLESNPPIGRLVIHINSNIGAWRNTTEDITVRAGDVLIVPKAPNFVLVSGQVYNPTAIAYRPGRSARWYLNQGGGPTHIADKKAIFVIRADGAVLGSQGSDSLWKGDALRTSLQPGDTVVVPEKAVGRSIAWQTVFLAGQVASSVVSAAFIAAH